MTHWACVFERILIEREREREISEHTGQYSSSTSNPVKTSLHAGRPWHVGHGPYCSRGLPVRSQVVRFRRLAKTSMTSACNMEIDDYSKPHRQRPDHVYGTIQLAQNRGT